MEYFSKMAAGEVQIVRDILLILQSPEALTDIGFNKDCTLAKGHAGYLEEKLLAKVTVDMVVHVAMAELDI